MRSTAVTVSAAAINDEYTPTIIAPKADGSSLLAWRDTSGSIIKLAKLGSTDTLQSYLPDIAGLEVHDVLNDSRGSVLAVVSNDPDIYSSKYCYGATTTDKNVCGKMDLVGIDASGNSRFRTTLTKKGNADSVGAQFIWWYGHTARIATDGSRYGVYYRSAMSTARDGVAGEVDIHAGDTLKFVSSAGAVESGGWDWGCSHSWSVRLGYNGSWGAACHGDAYPNAMKLSRLSSSTATASDLSWLSGTDAATRALGGLVPVSGSGFWMNYIQTSNSTLVLKLAKLGNSGTTLSTDLAIAGATGLDATYPFRPYMAALGSDKLLLGWKAGGKMVIATASASTGAILEGPYTTATSASNFQEFIPAPNGDVVWAHSAGGKTITVNRVAACKL
ncbi:hypothetical protein Q9Q94_08885 [Uliginosibacterium sp. 31-16]|uniref:hypothetical protein n=1 Tax=Uliginosibacterium sp. 31-16 TaxID=3068315 RepID=UPI00273FFBB8|nr:hypothetical protein [Uliginosibacterium sp. 31-16]MDP5239643.1 hypothetical protein [Uliginosibacterium sp. 31-16]